MSSVRTTGRPWGRWASGIGAAATLILALAGCGGGGDGGGFVGGGGGGAPPGGGGGAPGAAPVPPAAVAVPADPAQFAALQPQIQIGGVGIASPPVVTFTIVDQNGVGLKGVGSKTQSATATVASYSNLAFSLAKLIPGVNGSPSRWVSYIVTTVPTKNATTGAITPAAPTRPSTDNTGTLVDNGNGTYSYTFFRDVTKIKDDVAAMTVSAPNNKADLDDLTYDPTQVHRLTIAFSGAAPGTGTNTPDGVQVTPAVPMKNPVNLTFDFIPATGKVLAPTDTNSRVIVNLQNCNQCHRVLGGIPGTSASAESAQFHGSNRNDSKYCVVCHTEQRKYGRTEAATVGGDPQKLTGSTYVVDGRSVGNFPNLIHKTHLGAAIVKSGYDFAGVKFNEVHYPQDIRNCTKCHDSTANAQNPTPNSSNWMNVPSRLACGACHDGINFATGKGLTLKDKHAGLTTSQFGHVGGAQADDSKCALCHNATAIDTVYHLPVTQPNDQSALHVAGGNANTNSGWLASNQSRLPAGAIKISYDVKSIARDANKRPVIVFKVLQNGVAKNLNDFATTAVSPATGQKELFDNFMGGPSLYFVWAVPQDGITAPADFNASASGNLRNIWNGSATGTGAGTLSGPDVDGYYTLTLTGVTVPDNAVMLTGGVGYSYNVTNALPLTQTNLADYPVSNSPVAGQTNKVGGLVVIAPNVQKVATGYTGRRPIVEDARCNACHQELGPFTLEAFHAGQRNDGTTCSWCHNPNRTSSGWTADSVNFVHAIHAAAKRSKPYIWHSVSATENFSNIHYPGILNDCETCHLPGTYDFSAAASSSALPNRLYRTSAASTIATTDISASYYVTKGLNYGSAFAFNAGTGVTTPAAGTTLVLSPIAAVCFACHDSDLAVAHIKSNGGSIYGARTTPAAGDVDPTHPPREANALAKAEQCALCHLSGKVADIKVMHEKGR